MNIFDFILSYGMEALLWYTAYVLIGSCVFGAYIWRRTGKPGY